jgi:hypothetical protein
MSDLQEGLVDTFQQDQCRQEEEGGSATTSTKTMIHVTTVGNALSIPKATLQWRSRSALGSSAKAVVASLSQSTAGDRWSTERRSSVEHPTEEANDRDNAFLAVVEDAQRSIVPSAEVDDAKEAIAFAILAHERWNYQLAFQNQALFPSSVAAAQSWSGRGTNERHATGAKRLAVLGQVSLPGMVSE